MIVFDVDTFRKRLSAARLERHADELIGLIELSIRLRSGQLDGEAVLGGSRLGGEPDLPIDALWPSFRGLPHSFIAQIDLADVGGRAGAEGLPPSGLLSFFFDGSQRVWGFDPGDRGGWHVAHTPMGTPLRRHAFPAGLPAEGRFSARALSPYVEQTFAPWESFDVEALGLSQAEALAYADCVPDDEERGPVHRLRGHPDMIQGDMQLECQLASNGLNCGDATAYEDPRTADLREGASSWRLLLQVDSDDDAGMMWGDVGRIYFWLRSEDLAARRFDAAWCILQCT